MDRILLMILLLGLLLSFIVAPFSGLALLMIFLLASAILWTGWTLVSILIRGKTSDSNS
ncbi:hypothetical protein [Scytonema millei]|uniref:Uncharacterized protein n=1 Tax=Scytonema millei VB511283 TaxID=1245923 RepID=A0A9X5E231_9CYAN|nr:hypothetical protein [Scytonema millei]NHC33729.1 hypothetical protein [Scytonema millei VB511283]